MPDSNLDKIPHGLAKRAQGPHLDDRNETALYDLRIEHKPIGTLKPFERNARKHSTRQIQQIAASIRQFGFTNPVLIDADNQIIAGHGRVEAAKLLELTEVPTIRLDHLSEAQKRAYIIADNKLAELAGWDPDILKIEFQFLSSIELAFDIEITGFDTAEIDLVLGGDKSAPADPEADEIPEPTDGPVVSRHGDLWLLGKHRLLCADARDPAAYERLLAGEKAQLVFTDPPYNVPIDGNVTGKGRIHHREFAMASGEMSGDEFTAFLTSVLTNLADASEDGSIHFICMDWRHLLELLTAGRERYVELKNICVWNKSNAGMGSFYRSQHELVLVFKNGTAPHINNFGLGERGRYRTNIWPYAGVNSLKASRMDELAMHPTVKPVALVADAIRDCSKRNRIVLDAFIGSGTTVIAAEKTGRLAYGLEIDPAYVDGAVRRYEVYTGETAVLAETGQTFAEVVAARASCAQPAPSVQTNATEPEASCDSSDKTAELLEARQ